jgi:hypothetical protein
MDFSRAAAALMASRGKATSMSFLGDFTGVIGFPFWFYQSQSPGT